MLVLIRAAYADALAAFHAEVREKLRGFWVEYPPVVDDGAGEEASGTVADGQTIVRVWEEASAPTQEAVEEIPITKKSMSVYSCFDVLRILRPSYRLT
jgi:hypothetical protein